LSGLNLAGANLQGATVTGADLSLANLRAANLLLVSGTPASAKGALYDSDTRWYAGAAKWAGVQKAAKAPASDHLYDGPLFDFRGTLDTSGTEIRIALNFQINLNRQVAMGFALGSSDLPEAARKLLPQFALSGTALADIKAAADIDLGVVLGSKTVGNGAANFTVPSADQIQTYINVNRLQAEAELQLQNLQALLNVAGLLDVGIEQADISLKAAVKAVLDDPDNRDGKGRVYLSEIAAAQGGLAGLIHSDSVASLSGAITLNAKGQGFNLNDFGLPVINLDAPVLFKPDATTGKLVLQRPDATLDVRLTETLRDKLLEVLDKVDSTANQNVLGVGLLNSKVPGLDQSINELLGFDSDDTDAVDIKVFALKQAAQEFFAKYTFSDTAEANKKTGWPTLREATQHLKRELAKKFGLPLDANRRDWSGEDLANYDFSKQSANHLRGYDFSGANLSGANFSGLNLDGVNFSGANLQGAIFDAKTSLRGANFDGADLQGITWTTVDLRGVNMANANLSAANLVGKDLSGADLSGALLEGADLSDSNLRNASLARADLSGARLENALAIGASFAWASYDGNTFLDGMVVDRTVKAVFGTALTTKVIYLGAGGATLDGQGYHWQGWDLSFIDFSVFQNLTIKNFDWSGVNLRGVNFSGVTFAGSINLKGVFAVDVTWPSIDFSSVFKFDGGSGFFFNSNGLSLPSWLTGISGYLPSLDFNFSANGLVSLRGWDLSGLDFSGLKLNLSGIDLSFANLSKLKFGELVLDFDTNWAGSIWSGLSFTTGKWPSLAGIFRDVDFSGFDFSGFKLPGSWGFDGVHLPDFSGARFAGALNVGEFLIGLKLKLQKLNLDLSLPQINFSFADFRGLDLSGLRGLFDSINWTSAGMTQPADASDWLGKLFQGFKLPSINLSDIKLPDITFDFSKLDLSFANLKGISFATPAFKGFNFDGANLRGIDLSGLLGWIKSASKAMFNKADAWVSGVADALKTLDMDAVVLDEVFAGDVSGPEFAVLPMFDTTGNEITLGLGVKINLDRSLQQQFEFGLANLAGDAATKIANFTASGSAIGRLVLHADLEAGLAVGTKSGDNSLNLPVPTNADLYFRINRFDAGAALNVYGLQASASLLGDLAQVKLVDSDFAVKAAAKVVVTDPDNSDGKGRITLKDLAALSGQGKTVGSLFAVTPAASLEGNLVFDASLGGVDMGMFGNPTLAIRSDIIKGKLTPQYFFDVSIDGAKAKENLKAIFDQAASVGDSLDGMGFMSSQLPFVGESLGGIMQSEDGRKLGDVLSFRRVVDGTKFSVLDDYYNKTGPHTYSGLISLLKDYLSASGDYSGLQSLFPNQYGETQAGPFTVGGGLE
ncbi:MAG: pentapeptide repeat-containing protein, partial [Vogesella sp.]|uniref:pentapeptide repeat-containing protein n=1 Tax=Vogesella sp. TaxID=1904252 RepID=UPI003F3BAFC9